MNFEILSHTADVRIKANGNTIPELFAAALQGLCSVLKPDFDFLSEPEIITEEISISSFDMTTLLIDFLAEALFQMHNEKALYYSCRIELTENNSLSAVFAGRKIDCFEKDVKAITYHEAEIITNQSGYMECIFVPDI